MNDPLADTHRPAAAVKRVLVVQYSQTGQLAAILERILAPLMRDASIEVHVERLVPQQPYPFPWPFFRFLDAFPESAHMVPPALRPSGLSGEEDFDLIILPYQVWYLAPSLPVTAFVKSPLGAKLLRDKPVVTVIACRNMWLMAQEKMKTLLAERSARLLDNVVFTDRGPTLATFFTTPRWLLTGKKNGFWGMPAAGVSESTIARSERFGHALRDALLNDQEKGDQPLLTGLQAVTADPRLLFGEKAGTRSFYLWGKLLRAAGAPGAVTRIPLLCLYVVFLIALIVSVMPISLSLQALTRPLRKRQLARMKTEFEQPSGSGSERMHLYGG